MSGRILTTHVGSLPRSKAVTDLVFAAERGELVDKGAFDRVMRHPHDVDRRSAGFAKSAPAAMRRRNRPAQRDPQRLAGITIDDEVINGEPRIGKRRQIGYDEPVEIVMSVEHLAAGHAYRRAHRVKFADRGGGLGAPDRLPCFGIALAFGAAIDVTFIGPGNIVCGGEELDAAGASQVLFAQIARKGLGGRPQARSKAGVVADQPFFGDLVGLAHAISDHP